MFEKFINGEKIPHEWNEGWLQFIKTGLTTNAQITKTYVSVNCTSYRSYGKILTSLINIDFNIYQTEAQTGLRAGRLAFDNIFCLTQIMKKIVVTGIEMHIVFVGLTKEYNLEHNLEIKKLFEVLDESPNKRTIGQSN